MEHVDLDLRNDVRKLLEEARILTDDVDAEVSKLVEVGMAKPLTPADAERLLFSLFEQIGASAERRGDRQTLDSLPQDVKAAVQRMVLSRRPAELTPSTVAEALGPRVQLQARHGIEVQPVKPTPWFHGRPVPMNGGFVRTSDLRLWDRNDRLDIHLNQFHQLHGRKPNPEELLEIMLSKMPLPGVQKDDEFQILDLARSIANDGVRKPPIIDLDGTLLDGNRRVAASYLILNSDHFTSDQKQRVEYTYVWQLTEHATEEHRYCVVVSLNFEPDYKHMWPDYVRARKVFDAWQAMLHTEPRNPSPVRMRELKKELSARFALGPDATAVNRYIKMVEWADDFEEYLVDDRGQDEYAVKHQANKRFQYFDELSKGTNAGGVAHTLGQHDTFKQLVFDLLFQDKIDNWVHVRKLKFYDDDLHKALSEARDEDNISEAREKVETAVDLAHGRQKETRVSNADTKIEQFVEWLENVPVAAFEAKIKRENLIKLRRAFQIVDRQIAAILGQVHRDIEDVAQRVEPGL